MALEHSRRAVVAIFIATATGGQVPYMQVAVFFCPLVFFKMHVLKVMSYTSPTCRSLIHRCVSVCVCARACVCVCAHTHTQTHMHTHTKREIRVREL